MKQYFLGVDVGGTKSHAVISDETGQVLGFGPEEPATMKTVGYKGFQLYWIWYAQAFSGLEKQALTAIGMGIAGLDWPTDEPLHRNVIRNWVSMSRLNWLMMR